MVLEAIFRMGLVQERSWLRMRPKFLSGLNLFEKVVEKGDGTVCGPLGEGKIKIEIEIDISICYG